MNLVIEGKKALIDTNILIYSTLEEDPRFDKSYAIVADAGLEDVELFISVQNLSEMYPNLTGPRMTIPDTPEIARMKILSIAELPHLTVLPITLEIQRVALDLCQRYGILKQRYFDMQLVATMFTNGIKTILTENTEDFHGISEVTAVNPFSS